MTRSGPLGSYIDALLRFAQREVLVSNKDLPPTCSDFIELSQTTEETFLYRSILANELLLRLEPSDIDPIVRILKFLKRKHSIPIPTISQKGFLELDIIVEPGIPQVSPEFRKSIRAGLSQDEARHFYAQYITERSKIGEEKLVVVEPHSTTNHTFEYIEMPRCVLSVATIFKQAEVGGNVECESGRFPRVEVSPLRIPATFLRRELRKYYHNALSRFEAESLQPFFSYLELPCVRSIAYGMPEGKRSLGSGVLAIACKVTGLTYREAVEIGREYYAKVDTDNFSFREIERWLDWAYSKDELTWSCNRPQDLGECDKRICTLVKKYYSRVEGK